jgi:hypothetical protein
MGKNFSAGGTMSGIKRTQVQSSNLRSVGYDPSSKVLEVEFKSLEVYQYFDVPRSVYDGLMNADSHGTYLNQYVKEARYRYKKM